MLKKPSDRIESQYNNCVSPENTQDNIVLNFLKNYFFVLFRIHSPLLNPIVTIKILSSGKTTSKHNPHYHRNTSKIFFSHKKRIPTEPDGKKSALLKR